MKTLTDKELISKWETKGFLCGVSSDLKHKMSIILEKNEANLGLRIPIKVLHSFNKIYNRYN